MLQPDADDTKLIIGKESYNAMTKTEKTKNHTKINNSLQNPSFKSKDRVQNRPYMYKHWIDLQMKI